MLKISNSEVTAFNSCKRKYYNDYILRIEKRKKGRAISIGIPGHEVLQTYYQHRKDNKSHDESRSHAKAKMLYLLKYKEEEYGLDNLMVAQSLLDKYFDYYGSDDNWEILEVEKYYNLPISNLISMPMRIDLLIRERDTGRIYLIDTKHTYDFWTPIKENLSPQFPKYIACLKANGIQVDGAIINQLRYRKLKDPTYDQIFKRSLIPLSDHKILKTLQYHITTSRNIKQFRELSPAEQEEQAVPLLDPKVCEFCYHQGLCEMQLEGAPTELYLEQFYKKNEYGYDETEE